MLAGVTVTITGCGSDGGTAPTPPATDKTGLIAGNHGHAATVTAAQQTAGGAVAISIQGTASHDHTLELTEAEIMRVRFGVQVVKDCVMSRNHVHTITFN
jgi:hypothetical protein